MAEPKIETYTVTKHAGPKVAGRVAKAGDELELTEPEARAELLAGTIIKGKKDSDAVKADPLAGSKKLEKIQQQASPRDEAPTGSAADPAATGSEQKPSTGGGKKG